MVSSTAAVIGSVIKVSRAGVVVVTARTDVAAVGVTAGWYWIASSPSTTTAPTEIVRPRMVIMDGRCG